MLINRIFYTLKPLIPRRLQIFFRRQTAVYKRKKHAHIWPVDPSAGEPPEGWTGWPDGKKFALVLIHDVDTQKGHDNVLRLVEMEEQLGFRSSFNFVPEKYKNSDSLRSTLRRRGFEIGVHGLKHDGKLFFSQQIFNERAVQINHYLKEWHAVGFTSPSMHHNLDWLHALDISYSTSTFDTDPFEPQPDGAGTIFPYWIQNSNRPEGYLELPYTLPQDHLLYIVLKEKNIDIWKKKLDWIADKGGLALLNTHSDYMNFSRENLGNEEYPLKYYSGFLEYINENYDGQYWHVLPKEMARFWLEVVSKAQIAFKGKAQGKKLIQ